jgi:hypothetical protein
MEEISVAHDEHRTPEDWATDHMTGCAECSRFAAHLEVLDDVLAAGRFDRAPNVAPGVLASVNRSRAGWWSVAAVALVGLMAGGLIGVISTRSDVGQARDLSELFHTSGTGLDGLSANLVVVERGVHEAVPERVYTGTLDYLAPERLQIDLVDTTEYSDSSWIPNDVRLAIADGDMVSTSGNACPVAALPGCLVDPITRALVDQAPFDDGVLVPLEIVGPGRTLDRPGGVEILGTTDLDGTPTIQVRSTVAAVELIGAVTDRGAWRELHPTDSVLMWLDEETLVPRRIEVFPTDTAERELWQLRRGYQDDPAIPDPIFILELNDVVAEPGTVEVDAPDDAPSLGFVETAVDVPEPVLPNGFEPHRTGRRSLPEGEAVEIASWSDGRSWIAIAVTRDWSEPSLFGVSSPFVETIDLGEGSTGYLSPTGDALAIHGDGIEVVLTGSVSRSTLVEAAASLGVQGVEIPGNWLQASTLGVDELPDGTLVPESEDWSMLGRFDEGAATLLLTGGGARRVIITQIEGDDLDPPTGPDFSEVEVRGVVGRHDLGSSTLEWVEDGRIVRMRSETVAIDELVDLAETMAPR